MRRTVVESAFTTNERPTIYVRQYTRAFVECFVYSAVVINRDAMIFARYVSYVIMSLRPSAHGNYAARDMSIVFGKHDFTADESGQQTIVMKRYIVHNDYNSTTIDNDIALVELKDDVVFTDHVSPICLPTTDAPDETKCFTTGWGTTSKYIYLLCDYKMGVCGSL